MHPILGKPGGSSLTCSSGYLSRRMLVYLLAVPGGLTWTEAFALGIPLCISMGSCAWRYFIPAVQHAARTRQRGAARCLRICSRPSSSADSGYLSAKALAHVLSDFSAFNGLEPRLSKNLPLHLRHRNFLYLLDSGIFLCAAGGAGVAGSKRTRNESRSAGARRGAKELSKPR